MEGVEVFGGGRRWWRDGGKSSNKSIGGEHDLDWIMFLPRFRVLYF